METISNEDARTRIDHQIGYCIDDLKKYKDIDSYHRGRGVAQAAFVIDIITEEEWMKYCDRLFEAYMEAQYGQNGRRQRSIPS